MKRLHVIDSHTGGEPTRLIINGFPQLAGQTIAEQLDSLRTTHDQWRRACLLEPRGNEYWSARCTASRFRRGPPAG